MLLVDFLQFITLQTETCESIRNDLDSETTNIMYKIQDYTSNETHYNAKWQ